MEGNTSFFESKTGKLTPPIETLAKNYFADKEILTYL